jgi:hypothetical protein
MAQSPEPSSASDPFEGPVARPAGLDPFGSDPFTPGRAPPRAADPALVPHTPSNPVEDFATASAHRDPAAGSEAATAELLRRLAEPVTVDVIEVPLRETLGIISKAAGLRIEIDRKALADVGIDPMTPVVFGPYPMPARSVLKRMLVDLDLTYVVRDGIVLVTTPEEANARLRTRVYPVSDLLYGLVPHGNPTADHDSLIDLITSGVAPTTWDDVGGPGACTGYGETIVVSQTDEVHDEVERLLAALRLSRSLHQAWQGGTLTADNGRTPCFVWQSAGNQQVLAALGEETRLECTEKPLQEVAAELARQHRIPILFERKALADVGIGTDSPVTARLAGQLRTELARTLKALDLTYVVRDDCLLITTPEESSAKLVTKAYPIFDLVGERPIARRNAPLPARLAWQVEPPDADALIDLMTEMISPTTWDDVGGPGAIEYFAAGGALIVSQTQDVHDEIEDLLVRLRATSRPLPKLDAAWFRRIAREPVVCIHRLTPGGSEKSGPAAVAKLVRRLVEPEAWNRAGHTIEAAGSALIVRAPPPVQDAVAEFLDDLGATRGAQWGFAM